MPKTINDKLLSWASDVEEGTIREAEKTARLPIVDGHVALMPDAHVGIGATVGSVIPTSGAIIPAAVGVDIGCGMIAVETDLSADQLPDDLDRFQPMVAKAVPAGLGKWHARATRAAEDWFTAHPPPRDLGELGKRALDQFGTLGSGNHFFEVCLDERDVTWIVLHSGSRGVGNKLATQHIERARALAKQLELGLDGRALVHRPRQGQRGQLQVLLARGRPAAQPQPGPQALHGRGHGCSDGQHQVVATRRSG
jgi:RNA-splicing ligase RtcB